ncbi:PiggyBac transposable element-derived protein 4-like [Plakobranchus ocellatus]|uniref:PiggyBac transposable element-derived protein 4-like n=1 Tax=Plakobranchus ocellatus TaxID=259542 RepID=A0AAV4BB38_9GAST|nr:PiggyBac transposable element-derived protein 4-like [Plakobranchus ocellatus]
MPSATGASIEYVWHSIVVSEPGNDKIVTFKTNSSNSSEFSDSATMAFEFLQAINFETDMQEDDNESDIDVEPENLEDELDLDSDAELQQPAAGDAVADITWSDILSDVSPQMQPFSENVGPVHSLDEGESEALDYFKLFIGDEQLEAMVVETNRYAEQQQRQKGPDKYWKPVDFLDICTFIAINIFFGLKKLPETALYWSADPFWREPYVADTMGGQRFTEINQYFHLADSDAQSARAEAGYDPLYKVRPLLDHVRSQCQAVYKPSRKLAVDEGMVGFTGRLGFKQYIKGKPTPWGIKIWCLAESKRDIYSISASTPGKVKLRLPMDKV